LISPSARYDLDQACDVAAGSIAANLRCGASKSRIRWLRAPATKLKSPGTSWAFSLLCLVPGFELYGGPHAGVRADDINVRFWHLADIVTLHSDVDQRPTEILAGSLYRALI